MDQKRMSYEEQIAVYAIGAAVKSMEHDAISSEGIERRMKGTRSLAFYRAGLSLVRKALVAVLETAPEHQQVQIRKNLRHAVVTRVTGETGVKTVDGFFVELKDLNVLGACAVQQCIMCNLDKQDQRRCPLQKVMDKIPIPKADYDDEDGCPYQWVKIPEVSE